jgi:hypothetical protein
MRHLQKQHLTYSAAVMAAISSSGGVLLEEAGRK